jgi:hypothetical protein
MSLLLAFQPHGLTVLGSPKLGSKILEKKIEKKDVSLCVFKNFYVMLTHALASCIFSTLFQTPIASKRDMFERI